MKTCRGCKKRIWPWSGAMHLIIGGELCSFHVLCYADFYAKHLNVSSAAGFDKPKQPMSERLLLWIANHFECHRIEGACAETLGPYLDRYFVVGGPKRVGRLGFTVYLHHIWRSDIERDLHDHPWNFLSIILTGGYTEYIDGGVFRYCRPGSILWRPAAWRHRLVLTQPAWTLVVRSRKKKSWGFWTKNGFVHWKQYEYNEGCE